MDGPFVRVTSIIDNIAFLSIPLENKMMVMMMMTTMMMMVMKMAMTTQAAFA